MLVIGIRLTDFERWNELGEADEKEEEVEEEFELIEEHHWDEGYHVVLLVSDLVAWIPPGDCPTVHVQRSFLHWVLGLCQTILTSFFQIET